VLPARRGLTHLRLDEHQLADAEQFSDGRWRLHKRQRMRAASSDVMPLLELGLRPAREYLDLPPDLELVLDFPDAGYLET